MWQKFLEWLKLSEKFFNGIGVDLEVKKKSKDKVSEWRLIIIINIFVTISFLGLLLIHLMC